MIKSFKIRIYPTKDQELLLWKHIGGCGFIYNYMLNLQEENYKNGGKMYSAFDMNKKLTPMKKQQEYEWLNEISINSLQRTCSDLYEAYQKFFKKITKHPKFKSRKRSKPNFPVRSERLYFNEKVCHIEKIGKVKYKTDFDLPLGKETKFWNARISFNQASQKWFLSFGMECESQAFPLNGYNVGIDLGIKESAVVAYDNKSLVFHNINKSKKMRKLNKRLKHLQRKVSRKYEANKQGKKYVKTKNIEKQEQLIRKKYAKISNIRMNYIHQSTHQIISLRPKQVVMEDLNVTDMMKNTHLSKAIQEQCFYEWRRQMQYKCEWNGIKFVLANRFYPSSKTCHNCGCIKKDLNLKDRTFICDDCDFIIDRDLNAALNLMNYED